MFVAVAIDDDVFIMRNIINIVIYYVLLHHETIGFFNLIEISAGILLEEAFN